MGVSFSVVDRTVGERREVRQIGVQNPNPEHPITSLRRTSEADSHKSAAASLIRLTENDHLHRHDTEHVVALEDR